MMAVDITPSWADAAASLLRHSSVDGPTHLEMLRMAEFADILCWLKTGGHVTDDLIREAKEGLRQGHKPPAELDALPRFPGPEVGRYVVVFTNCEGEESFESFTLDKAEAYRDAKRMARAGNVGFRDEDGEYLKAERVEVRLCVPVINVRALDNEILGDGILS